VQEVCPVVALPENSGQLPRMLPAHMLAKLRYDRHRAEKLAARMEQARPENFPALFEGFLQHHQPRWTARGQGGVLADGPLREFHREAAERLLASGTLRLYGLRLGDRLMASLYGFSHGRRTFYYLGGFDPAFAPLSPGTLMIGHAIEEAIREGVGEFDFLRGREAYKYLWGAKGRLNYRRQLRRSRGV
jgi:CelD/BcsL family acetyltransferase involved in cellulose biosynthesis